MIDRPGIYTMDAATYHGDPCPIPSLSSSVARELLRTSAYHVHFAHPRLGAAPQDDDADEAMDIGTAAHAYLLEGREAFVVINEPNYRTKTAQVAKAEARAAGKVPLLVHRWNDVMNMATAALQQLQRHEDPPLPFTAGKPEQTIVWQEDGIWLRARLDWLHDDHRTVDDLKTTRVPAHPDLWSKLLFRMQYDVQAAFYLRGLKAVTGIDATFRFVVQENRAPFALSVIGLAPSALALAERKVTHAIEAWKHSVQTDTWPGYPRRTCWAEAPAWAEAQQLERELQDVDDEMPLADQLMGETR